MVTRARLGEDTCTVSISRTSPPGSITASTVLISVQSLNRSGSLSKQQGCAALRICRERSELDAPCRSHVKVFVSCVLDLAFEFFVAVEWRAGTNGRGSAPD